MYLKREELLILTQHEVNDSATTYVKLIIPYYCNLSFFSIKKFVGSKADENNLLRDT